MQIMSGQIMIIWRKFSKAFLINIVLTQNNSNTIG